MLKKEEIQQWFQHLQDNICNALEEADGKGKFRQDLWSRPEGGGGRTRIIEKGNVIEKGGVNFSSVNGELSDKLQKFLNVPAGEFLATGVSIVIHPVSPMVPIIHMNVRYFEVNSETRWFGGGIDLTPHYIFPEDAKFFHQQLKMVCDKHHPDYYPEFKKWADNYFYIKHREETRGIGGIFFDRLKETQDISIEKRFDFVKHVGLIFAPTYINLMNKNKELPYGEKEKNWQMVRRSRYVEFNLVYDAGTKFGLESNGRIESILMSMPPVAVWEYDHHPEKDSPEEKTLNLLKKDINWL